MRPSIHRLSIVCFAVLVATRAAVAAPWGTLEQTEALFKQADQSEHVTVEVVGRSVEGRPIHAVRIASLDREKASEPVVAMLVGLQHGDEPAAGRALLDLIRDVAADRSILPATLDLHVIPIANPDGAVADRRRNANEFDLNRDHQLLSQPETVALHAYARRVRPHLVVDGHEFNRTTSDYLERGWTEWPIITLGACNSPLLPSPLPAAANALIDQVDAEVNAAGFNFTEYLVGDAPTVPGGELRPSTLDTDDCRNGLAMHGAVGFIIESGVPRAAADPHADLTDRVAAYRTLLHAMLGHADRLEAVRRAAEAARAAPAPDAIATDFFWARTDASVTPVRVIDAESHRTLAVSTASVMGTPVVKAAVAAPLGYAIDAGRTPGAMASYLALLERHGIATELAESPRAFVVQPVILRDVEEGYDERYHRYAGRQITSAQEPRVVTLPVGSIVMPLDGLSPIDARRAAALLEPQTTFGLYQWPAFAALVDDDGRMPVLRLLSETDTPPAASEAPP